MPVMPPPERAPHAGCLSAWPTHTYAWGKGLRAAQDEFEFFLRCFCRQAGEPLWLLCPLGRLPEALRDLTGEIRPIAVPYGDVWLRDTGPVFLDPRNAISFAFNGWGGKYNYPHDAVLARALAKELDTAIREFPFTCEGGALEWDGAGTVVTTEPCLLNRNRNPGISRSEAEGVLCQALGARHVIWLGYGLINDHTDGHVDNLARFVGPDTVVCTQAVRGDPNERILAEVAARLRESRTAAGRPLSIDLLPAPGMVLDDEGQPLPASYTNFYIANDAVFVPAYGLGSDDRACEVLSSHFPGREIVSIPSRAILAGGGSLHCVTQQIPTWSQPTH